MSFSQELFWFLLLCVILRLAGVIMNFAARRVSANPRHRHEPVSCSSPADAAQGPIESARLSTLS